MRKYFVGAVVGFLLASAIPAYGAVSSLVGKKIQNEYTVYVDGIALETKAIAIDGTSYAPNRALADALGVDIAFKNKSVVVTTYGDEPGNDGGEGPVPTNDPGTSNGNGGSPSQEPQPSFSSGEIEAGLRSVNAKINSIKRAITTFEQDLARATTDEERSLIEQKIANERSWLAQLEAEKARLEAMLK